MIKKVQIAMKRINCPVLQKKNSESGQSFVEFAFLLFSIVAISALTMRTINGHVAERWLNMAKLILEDDKQQIRLR